MDEEKDRDCFFKKYWKRRISCTSTESNATWSVIPHVNFIESKARFATNLVQHSSQTHQQTFDVNSFRRKENDSKGPGLCKSWLKTFSLQTCSNTASRNNFRQFTSHLHPIRTLATNRYECVLIAMGCTFQEHTLAF